MLKSINQAIKQSIYQIVIAIIIIIIIVIEIVISLAVIIVQVPCFFVLFYFFRPVAVQVLYHWVSMDQNR